MLLAVGLAWAGAVAIVPHAAWAQQITDAYLLSTFEAPDASDPPFKLTGRSGVRLTLNAQGVATGVQDVANLAPVLFDLPLPYRLNVGGLKYGAHSRVRVTTLPERVNHALVRFDDIGFKPRDAKQTVPFRKGTKLVLTIDKLIGALVFGEDGGLDPFRLEYSATDRFESPTVLFDGFDTATKAAILARSDFSTGDFAARKLDQAYLFFVTAPPGFLRITETVAYGPERLKLDCALGHAAACGDGLKDPGETCDPPGETCTAQSPCNACRADCTRCGDGFVQSQDGETCEGPGSVQASGNVCRSPTCTFCGDAIVQDAEDETCDPPQQICDMYSCHVVCRQDCTRCGDGKVQSRDGESCDKPGTPQSPFGDLCRETCTFCGDGVTQSAEGETCDGQAGCRNDCTSCGDGVVQLGDDETCENPGSPQPPFGNACRSGTCTFCGDTHVDAAAGETCDPPGSDGCRPDCTKCGDGVVQGAEECDGSGCSRGFACAPPCGPDNPPPGCFNSQCTCVGVPG